MRGQPKKKRGLWKGMRLPKLLTRLLAVFARRRAQHMDAWWTVSIVAKAPEESGDYLGPEVAIDDRIELALEQLGGAIPVVAAHAAEWYAAGFMVQTYEGGFESAVSQALGVWGDLVVKAELPEWEIRKLEVCLGEVRPNIAPPDADPRQAWYWTPEWLAGQREAERELQSGRVRRFDNEEDFFSSLR